MMILVKEFFDQVKGILKRAPGVRRLFWLRGKIIFKINRIRELSGLIKKNRIVVFNPCSRSGNDETSTYETVHEVLKEWIDLYGIIRLRRTTAAAIDAPAGAILLYMPQACLGIPSTHEEYLEQVKRDTRRLIRVAERQGYEFKEFVWNDHLGEIYAINTSKEIRQGEPMRGWYRQPVQPRHHSKVELQYRKYYGAFKDGKLCAYSHLLICGNFAFPIHIMGHAQHLKYGIMNGLISHLVRECIGLSQIQWLHYGRFQEESSLDAFKKHAGFQKYALLLDLEHDQELLKYSARMVKTWWRI